MSTVLSDDVNALKQQTQFLQKRCAELEYRLAAALDQVSNSRKENERLREQTLNLSSMSTAHANVVAALERTSGVVQNGGSPTGNNTYANLCERHGATGKGDGGASSEDNFRLQRALADAHELNQNMASEMAMLKERLQRVQDGFTKDVNKARFDLEKEVTFLRHALEEERLKNEALRRSEVAADSALTKRFHLDSMNEEVSHTVLIPLDSLFQRMRADMRANAFQSKYNVSVKFSPASRSIVLTGKRIYVELLKGEIYEILNDMHSRITAGDTLIQNRSIHNSEASRELSNLTQTISTHENTIATLHSAVTLAQQKAAAAQEDAAEARAQLAPLEEQIRSLQSQLQAKDSDLKRRVATIETQRIRAESASEKVLAELQEEAALAQKYREENAKLRRELLVKAEEAEEAKAAKESAENQARILARRVDEHAERARASAVDRDVLETLRSNAMEDKQTHSQAVQNLSIELGQFQQQLAEKDRVIEDLRRSENELRRQLNGTLNESNIHRELIEELRQRMLNLISDQDASRRSAGAVDHLVATPGGTPRLGSRRLGARDVSQLQGSVAPDTLKEALEQSLRDIRELAVALRHAQDKRDEALAELERLQIEKGQWEEERLAAERDRMNEQLHFRQEKMQLLMQIRTLEDELLQYRSRNDVVQRRLVGLSADLNATADAVGPTSRAAETRQHNASPQALATTIHPSSYQNSTALAAGDSCVQTVESGLGRVIVTSPKGQGVPQVYVDQQTGAPSQRRVVVTYRRSDESGSSPYVV